MDTHVVFKFFCMVPIIANKNNHPVVAKTEQRIRKDAPECGMPSNVKSLLGRPVTSTFH